MQTPRTTRSSVLGKRGHQHQDSSSGSPVTRACPQLQTPDASPNPKRARTTNTKVDGDGNKENVPPFSAELINVDSPTSARAVRALRRTTTEAVIPPRPASLSTVRRHSSASAVVPATPTVEISHLSITTPPPTPPNSLLPVHVRARALLRSTCNGANAHIAGRDAERATIQDFLSSFIGGTSMDADDALTSLYISGSPGTGKTALVNSIIRALGSDNTDIKVISINCMALTSVDALWERIIEELEPAPKKKAGKKTKGKAAVEALLSSVRNKCIVILDELDHITATSQLLSSIFSLPDAASSSLRLIGIANTHTLTASSTSVAFSSITNVRTLHFAPYTPVQLLQILQSRLASLSDDTTEGPAKGADKKFLPAPTLTLLTKKIASLTGDVRSLFEVLRGAIDIAVASPSKSSADENPLNPPASAVTPSHILAALKAYTPSSMKTKTSTSSSNSTSSSETITKVRDLGLQHRLVLLSILLASKRLEASLCLNSYITSSPKKSPTSPIKRSLSAPNALTAPVSAVGIETNQLHAYYTAVLNRSDSGIFDPVSRSEFGDLLGMLETIGLVSLSSSLLASVSSAGGAARGRKAFGRSTSFGPGLVKNGTGSTGEVRMAEGVLGNEIIRGLGISDSTAVSEGATDEEVRGIWERERARLGRDLKALSSAAASAARKDFAAFADASED